MRASRIAITAGSKGTLCGRLISPRNSAVTCITTPFCARCRARRPLGRSVRSGPPRDARPRIHTDSAKAHTARSFRLARAPIRHRRQEQNHEDCGSQTDRRSAARIPAPDAGLRHDGRAYRSGRRRCSRPSTGGRPALFRAECDDAGRVRRGAVVQSGADWRWRSDVAVCRGALRSQRQLAQQGLMLTVGSTTAWTTTNGRHQPATRRGRPRRRRGFSAVSADTVTGKAGRAYALQL